MKKKFFAGLAAGLFLFGVVQISNASVLTFDGLSGYNYQPINQNYGDSITSTSDSYGQYLEGNGFTPHINVAYNTVGGNAYLEAWDTDYGNLVNVAYADYDGGTAEILFTPDYGYEVTINRFDMAGWYLEDKTASLIEIVNGAGTTVWSASSLFVSGQFGTHSVFFPGITGSELTIRWGNDWNIGIDNINFDESRSSEAVPEPATMLLFGVGLAGLAGYSRRRQAKKK